MKAIFTEKNDSSISFVPIIRTGELIRSYDYSKFDMEAAEYQLMNPPTEFYSINFALDGADLELEEEQFQSHELEYHRYGFDDEEIPDRVLERFRENGAYNFLPLEKDPKTEHVETRGYFIDSIGTKMLFQGDYELYYPNGQLFTRYNFGQGNSLYEDTLFWDSGAPHDVIIYLSDSNHYERTIYDYDGVPVRTAVYDSLGDFRNFIIDLDKEEEILIEGITASRINKSIDLKFNKDSVLRGNFEYRNWGAAKDSLHEKEIFYKLWSGYDSSVLAQTTYDPATKTLLYSENSYAGNTFAQINRKFTEDFQGWTSNSIWKYGDFELRRTSSGILEEFQNDTFPQRHVSSSYTDYDVTNDYVLYLKGEKYTGKGNIKFNKPRFKSSGAKMKTSYSRYLNYGRVKRPVYKYYRTGKIKNSDLFGVTNTIYGVNGIQRSMFYDLYSDVLGDFFSYGGSGGYYSDYGMYEKGGVKKVKGRMVNGKPQGVWKSKSMNGKVMGEIAFIDGEAQGVFKSYTYEPRATRWQRKYSEEELPKKRIYYLHSTVNYENGLKNGDLRVYDWKGELKQKGTYVDDYLEGAYLERYSMAYSVSNYNRGMLDGYVQTYLTLPNRDTMLLYDLNFQHDLLNGESIAYHTNGRVAKRGFFLDGEPIDDYEAYDTLGFKYHYVKFK
jgi:antitoxin component YwqK of YwqJK toxin-antitoxin module